jgi:hypothetical protein
VKTDVVFGFNPFRVFNPERVLKKYEIPSKYPYGFPA